MSTEYAAAVGFAQAGLATIQGKAQRALEHPEWREAELRDIVEECLTTRGQISGVTMLADTRTDAPCATTDTTRGGYDG